MSACYGACVEIGCQAFFETESLYLALDVLEFTMYIRLSSNSEICSPLPLAGIKGVVHYAQVGVSSYHPSFETRSLILYHCSLLFLRLPSL